MDDLSYIIGLGFSGSDIWRAIIIAFFAAMLVRQSKRHWGITFWALIVDRTIWPLTDMAIYGATRQMISDAFTSLLQSLPDDLGIYAVRYAGLYVMIGVFLAMRKRIHRKKPEKPKAKPAYV